MFVINARRLAVSAVLLAACGGASPSLPTSPTPSTTPPAVAAAPAPVTFGVSGTITESTPEGRVPLSGALVKASTGTTTTNAQGFYTISGLDVQPPSVTVSKDGYKSETRPLNVPPNAFQTFVDVQLVRLSHLHSLSGVVSEANAAGVLVPAAGVKVTALSCATFGCAFADTQTMLTDRNGSYRFADLYAGKNNFVWFEAAGYDVVGMPPVPTCDSCNAIVNLEADTRLDVQLVRR